MPEFPMPVTGRFCWVELQAKDPAGAKKFYSELFGWTIDDMPMGPMTYTIFKVGGKQVAGLLPQPPSASGAPPAWGNYVAVDDVKASTDAAAKLGAKVLVGPTPMGPGTFSLLADPAGGLFLLWHTKQPMGAFLYGEVNSLCWNELISTNPDVAQRFYTQLFGWKAEAMPMPGTTYTVFKQETTSIGGLMAQQVPGAPSVWVPYFAVADADASFKKATALGAKTIMPLTDVPQVGRFGWLADPQGATFALIKNAM
jgi:predicted enzyme related to lactoylglutathione lyase